jgi:hypothetical protein
MILNAGTTSVNTMPGPLYILENMTLSGISNE